MRYAHILGVEIEGGYTAVPLWFIFYFNFHAGRHMRRATARNTHDTIRPQPPSRRPPRARNDTTMCLWIYNRLPRGSSYKLSLLSWVAAEWKHSPTPARRRRLNKSKRAFDDKWLSLRRRSAAYEYGALHRHDSCGHRRECWYRRRRLRSACQTWYQRECTIDLNTFEVTPLLVCRLWV